MAQAAAVSYLLTFLLREAKAGNLKSSGVILEKLCAIGDGDLSSYIIADDILAIVHDNLDYICKSYRGDVDTEFGWISSFESFKEKAAKGGDPNSISMLEFDDYDEHSRLVYEIALNKNKKRVVVIFRGTYAEGTKDWKRNIQYNPCRVNILTEFLQFRKEYMELPKIMHLHTGFYEYLFRNIERGAYELECYEEVLINIIGVLQDYPDYKLYITGHSLGGSLALLTSFYIASSNIPQISKPVTCISVGSPCVGDQSFLDAFRVQEKAGCVRHLRITNHGNPIAHLPPFLWYRHVGLNLLWGKEDGHKLLYPTEGVECDPFANWKALLSCATREPATLRNNHSLAEYLKRLLREKKAIEKASNKATFTRCLGECF